MYKYMYNVHVMYLLYMHDVLYIFMKNMQFGDAISANVNFVHVCDPLMWVGGPTGQFAQFYLHVTIKVTIWGVFAVKIQTCKHQQQSCD
jgi:hypothetical protein